MSAPKKLTAPDSALTKFKVLWRDSLAEPIKDYWREQFISPRTQAELRSEIARNFKLKLTQDKQLNAFRAWLEDQDVRDAQAERMAENERRIKTAHPDWTLDQVRENVLKESYYEVLATGNHELGLRTVAADMKSKSATLDERKLVLLEKKAAAFDAAKGVMADQALSDEQKRQRMLELFGM